jgi:hypothetical protein
MTDEQGRSGGSRAAMAVLWGAIAVAVALLLPLRGTDASVELYGLEVAVWLLAVVFYLVGTVAGWASFRARRG